MPAVVQQLLLATGGGIVLPAATEAFQGNAGAGGSASSSFSFTSQPFGAADAARQVFVVVDVRGSTQADMVLSSATIGGVTATVVASALIFENNTTTAQGVYILRALVPSGTTGTVALAFANNVWAYIGIYRVTNLASLTPVDTKTDTLASGQVKTLNINVVPGGIVIATGAFYTQLSVSMTAGVTQDFYTVFSSPNRAGIGGSAAIVTTQTGMPVTFQRQTSDGLSMSGAFAAVSFR